MSVHTGEKLKMLKNMQTLYLDLKSGLKVFLNIRECILEKNSTFVKNVEKPVSKIMFPTEFVLESEFNKN